MHITERIERKLHAFYLARQSTDSRFIKSLILGPSEYLELLQYRETIQQRIEWGEKGLEIIRYKTTEIKICYEDGIVIEIDPRELSWVIWNKREGTK